MTEYIRQTKANIEDKMTDRNIDNESDDGMDVDQPPTNFIIDNFKAAHNTFNVILAQREIDMQRITSLSVKVEQGKAMVDKLDSQKYHMALENANLKIELDESKQLSLKATEKKTQDGKLVLEKVNQSVKTFMDRAIGCNIMFIIAFMITYSYTFS